MSTIQHTNFEPLSDMLGNVQTRTFDLVDSTLLNGLSTTAIVDGEWFSFSGNKIVRAANIAAAGNNAGAPSWIGWGERGRTDQQVIKAITLVYLGAWEADVRLFDATNMTVGGVVAVQSIDLGGKIVAGLVNAGTLVPPAAGAINVLQSRIPVGIVTRLPNTNNQKLRIRGGMFF